MRKRLGLIMSLVLIAGALGYASNVTAGTRRTVSFSINASVYCNYSQDCVVDVIDYDSAVLAEYRATVRFASYAPYTTNKNASCPWGPNVYYCVYVSPNTCSNGPGCYSWGGAIWSHGSPYQDQVDTWIYANTTLYVTVTGTTSGYVNYNGYRVATWY